MAIFMTETLLN